MTILPLTLTFFAAGFATAAAGRTMTSMLRSLARLWRWERSRAQLNELDDHALRDLGVDRSEFMSYFAESERFAPATRRRTVGVVEHSVPSEPAKPPTSRDADVHGSSRHATTSVCHECGRNLDRRHRLRATHSLRNLLASAHVAARP